MERNVCQGGVEINGNRPCRKCGNTAREYCGRPGPDPTFQDLARLRAENERWREREADLLTAIGGLRAENERLRKRRNEIDDEAEEYSERCRLLEVEIERLRMALATVLNHLDSEARMHGPLLLSVSLARDAASRGLRGPEKQESGQ